MNKIVILSLLLLTACEPVCEIQWDGARKKYFGWCDKQIVSISTQKQDVLNDIIEYRKRPTTRKEKVY